jgi:chitinase
MRLLLRRPALLGLLLASLSAAPAHAQTVSCTGVPNYSPSTIYNPGDRAVHNGKLYEALIQIWNTPPDYCGTCGWWRLLGTCGGGGGDTTAPSVPTGLNSPAKTATTVSLAWNASTDNPGGSGVAGYDVFRNGTVAGSPTATSFTVTGLTANTAYSFTVRARDNAGNASAQSAALSVTTSGGGTCSTLPGVPGGLNSPSKTDTSVSLAWTASAPGANCTVQYRVFRNGTQIDQVAATGYTAQGLAPGTTYSFTVAAINQFGSSAQSAPLSVTTNSAPPPPPPPTGGPKILGYFAQWGVYARNYHVKNIVTSGSATKLTHINYAFGNVTNGQCVIGDSYADYDRFYDAASSVDGVADTWDAGVLRGSFNQLRKLKQLHPHIKVLWSFGGWTWSGGFGQAAANPTAFANSCYNLVHDPRWNGVFDGIDIDWEYPNSCGLSCDSSGPQAYVNLMSALRARFGSKLVTAAVPAGFSHINAANYGGAAQYVDWYNVMTYDFFGTWAASGPTAPHSPLTSYAGIPQANFYGDYAIQLYKQKGVPASKLLLGVGFYGRGWAGVPNVNGGLNQPASGPAPGTYEQGNEDYKVLVSRCPATGTVAGTAMAYCGGQWWSYDTPATLAGKMTYKKNQGLGGTFFWELSGDTSSGALIKALFDNR